MNTTSTWYPPAALQPSTYDPSAGTGGLLANPPFRPMADITARTLRARRLCGDRVVLDWLELVRIAEPLAFGCRSRGAHIYRICDAWQCSQPMASRRIAAINAAPSEAGLGRVERARGAHGWWRVLEGP